VIEPKSGFAINGKDQPDLEVEVTPGNGLAFKDPVLKDKTGVKGKARELVLELTLDEKAKKGEAVLPVEVRLVAVKGKDATKHTIKLATPVLIP